MDTYDPQYLMTRGKNHPQSQYLFNAFCQNTRNPEYTCTAVSKMQISKNEIYKKTLNILKLVTFYGEIPIEEDPKLCRFKLNEILNLTITCKGNGYIAIRENSKHVSSSDNYLQMLNEYDFLTSEKAWLGYKDFKNYGINVDSIVNSIIEEIEKIKQRLRTC